jgi:hypothetical protein
VIRSIVPNSAGLLTRSGAQSNHDAQMHITERYTRQGDERLDYLLTLDHAEQSAASCTASVRMKRIGVTSAVTLRAAAAAAAAGSRPRAVSSAASH